MLPDRPFLSTGPSLLFHFLPLLLEHLLSNDENAALHLVAGLLTIIPPLRLRFPADHQGICFVLVETSLQFLFLEAA